MDISQRKGTKTGRRLGCAYGIQQHSSRRVFCVLVAESEFFFYQKVYFFFNYDLGFFASSRHFAERIRV